MTAVIEWTATALVMVASGVLFACAVVGVEPWNL